MTGPPFFSQPANRPHAITHRVLMVEAGAPRVAPCTAVAAAVSAAANAVTQNAENRFAVNTLRDLKLPPNLRFRAYYLERRKRPARAVFRHPAESRDCFHISKRISHPRPRYLAKINPWKRALPREICDKNCRDRSVKRNGSEA